MPYPLPPPPNVSTRNPVAHKSLKNPRSVTTRHYQPPANFDDDSELSPSLQVDSAPELNESLPVVPNEPRIRQMLMGPPNVPLYAAQAVSTALLWN